MSKNKKHGIDSFSNEVSTTTHSRMIVTVMCAVACITVFMIVHGIYRQSAAEKAFLEFMENTSNEIQDEETVSGASVLSLLHNAAIDSIVDVRLTNGDTTVEVHKDSGDCITDSEMEQLEAALKGRKAERFVLRDIKDKDGAYVGQFISMN